MPKFTDDFRDDATKAFHSKLDALEKPTIEALTSAHIAAIGTERRVARYHAESDGEPHAKTHYVTHTTRHFREDCPTRDRAVRRAKELNDLEAVEARAAAREAVRDIAFLVQMGREADAIRTLDQYSLTRY